MVTNKKTIAHNQRNANPLDSWKIRRRMLFATLIFCAIAISVCWFGAHDFLTVGKDMVVNRDAFDVYKTIINASFQLSGILILGYIFGAVAEDWKKMDRGIYGIHQSSIDDNDTPTDSQGTKESSTKPSNPNE